MFRQAEALGYGDTVRNLLDQVYVQMGTCSWDGCSPYLGDFFWDTTDWDVLENIRAQVANLIVPDSTESCEDGCSCLSGCVWDSTLYEVNTTYSCKICTTDGWATLPDDTTGCDSSACSYCAYGTCVYQECNPSSANDNSGSDHVDSLELAPSIICNVLLIVFCVVTLVF